MNLNDKVFFEQIKPSVTWPSTTVNYEWGSSCLLTANQTACDLKQTLINQSVCKECVTIYWLDQFIYRQRSTWWLGSVIHQQLPMLCDIISMYRPHPVVAGRRGHIEGSIQGTWKSLGVIVATESPASLFLLVGRNGLKFRTPLIQSLPSIMALHLRLVQEERLIYGMCQ